MAKVNCGPPLTVKTRTSLRSESDERPNYKTFLIPSKPLFRLSALPSSHSFPHIKTFLRDTLGGFVIDITPDVPLAYFCPLSSTSPKTCLYVLNIQLFLLVLCVEEIRLVPLSKSRCNVFYIMSMGELSEV